MKRNCFIAIGVASPKEVDDLNVLKATHLAMKRAIYNLPCQPEKILIDAAENFNLPIVATNDCFFETPQN